MSVNLRDSQKYTITDFSGGLNEFASSYKLADNELIACENVTLRDSGGIKSSPGSTMYQNQNYAANGEFIATAVNNQHRYVTIDGTRKMVLYGGQWIGAGSYDTSIVWADSDDGNYDPIAKIVSGDDRCRFEQFRDTLLMATTESDVHAYKHDFTYDAASDYPNTFAVNLDPGSHGFYTAVTDTGNGLGKLDTEGYYYYRFTLDIGTGEDGDFLGETSPLTSGLYYSNYLFTEVDVSAITTNDLKVEFKRFWDQQDFAADVRSINIYRSSLLKRPYSANTQHTGNIEVFYIGSVKASVFNALSNNEIFFTDDGTLPVGVQAEYNKMPFPPRAKFIEYHNNRLWYGNVKYSTGNSFYELEETVAPSRLFLSHINNHGNQEPIGVYSDRWLDIDPTDGYGITGLMSYMNKFLVVFKPNSTWVVRGDTYGSITLNNISPNIGCVAPESVQVVDGRIVWLSNSGVYYFDGSIPKPLKADNVYDTINNIPPAQRLNACAAYDVNRREYLLAHAGTDTDGYNRYVSKFDMRTAAWSRDKKPSPIGISSFVQKNLPDERTEIFAGVGDVISVVLGNTAVVKLNDGWTNEFDDDGGGVTLNPIDFSFQTKFYDLGLPYMDKDFNAILIEISTPEDLTLNIRCDKRLNTNTDAGGGFTIYKPTGEDLVWYDSGAPTSNMLWNDAGGTNDNVWATSGESASLVYLDSRCWGKRISIEISGSVKKQASIASITIFWSPIEGVRQ